MEISSWLELITRGFRIWVNIDITRVDVSVQCSVSVESCGICLMRAGIVFHNMEIKTEDTYVTEVDLNLSLEQEKMVPEVTCLVEGGKCSWKIIKFCYI